MEPLEGTTSGALNPIDVSTKLQRIAMLAKMAPKAALTSLAHHIDVAFLEEAFRRTRKEGAPGIDGSTAVTFAAKLQENLQSLLGRFKSGSYRAPAVRRVLIPKGNGKTRPIGIPTFEDKVLSAGGDDGAGGRVRAGLHGLQFRLPAGALRALGAGGDVGGADGDSGWVGGRGRHQVVLRQPRPSPPEELSGPEGA